MTSSDTPTTSGRKTKALKIALGISLGLLISVGAVHLAKKILRPASKPFSYTRLSQSVVKVPLRLVNGLPTVEVMINQRGPYRLMLDTGASNVHVCGLLGQGVGLT